MGRSLKCREILHSHVAISRQQGNSFRVCNQVGGYGKAPRATQLLPHLLVSASPAPRRTLQDPHVVMVWKWMKRPCPWMHPPSIPPWLRITPFRAAWSDLRSRPPPEVRVVSVLAHSSPLQCSALPPLRPVRVSTRSLAAVPTAPAPTLPRPAQVRLPPLLPQGFCPRKRLLPWPRPVPKKAGRARRTR